MDIVKKNLLSIICGVIALVALVIPFWPMGGYEEELQASLKKKKESYGQLETMERKGRTLPTLVPGATESTPLTQFPSEKVIERGEAVTAAVKDESQRMYQVAVALNKDDRTLLVDKSLPRPRTPEQIAFRERYVEVFRQTLTDGILKGATPPVADEVKAEIDRRWKEVYSKGIWKTPGGESNEATVKAQAEEDARKLPEEMRVKRASAAKVYVDPGAFDEVRDIFSGQPPEPAAIWWAQVGIWAQTDLARAIAATNAGATNVMTAPVKRLVRIECPREFVSTTTGQMPGGSSGGYGQVAEAAPVSQDVDGPLPKAPTISPTGRVSNAMYDVLHATMTVEMEAAYVPQFMAELGNGRFITVLRADVTSVDSIARKAEGFYYGAAPVVQVRMELEMLFMRAWTAPYMPDSIRRALGIGPTQGGVALQ